MGVSLVSGDAFGSCTKSRQPIASGAGSSAKRSSEQQGFEMVKLLIAVDRAAHVIVFNVMIVALLVMCLTLASALGVSIVMMIMGTD